MNQSYFEFTRTEIEPLLPGQASDIIDVGCGAGNTSAWLKSKYPSARVVGLEGNASMRPTLLSKLDDVHIVDLNGAIPSLAPADLILFLDVLEHLHNPEQVLRDVLRNVRSDGHVIVSLPNIAHLSVSAPLFVHGRFRYQDAGILDRTHVRFYVRNSAVQLLNDAGLLVRRGLESGLSGPKTKWLDRMTLGRFRDHLTKQYILLATPMRGNNKQGPIRWDLARESSRNGTAAPLPD